ncbi:MAG: TIM44-like domain-containing protein [Victivallales bacterium]|nr:TIM44-like domain-containing protein [Victivallales bacterium]
MYNFCKCCRRTWLPVLLFLILLICESVYGRAGGGGGFRSSGGFSTYSHSGGYRSGSSGQSGDFILLLLIFQYPYISIPLILGIVLLLLFGGNKVNHTRQDLRIRRGLTRLGQEAMKRAREKILSRDPDFTESGLCERVKGAFMVIQQAWSEMNMKTARAFISDGIYERFSLQLAMYESSGIRNSVSGIKVHACAIVSLRTDDFFDSVDIKITAGAVDRYLNAVNGSCISGNSRPELFTEYWTLLRRPGAKTKSAAGLFENCCPNCGAPLPLLDRVECPACKALINSGEYDWVLAEITQESEYSVTLPRNIPGLKTIRQTDPACNVNHIEDRASAIFFRHVAAQFFGNPQYLVKLASKEYMHTNRNDFKVQADGMHRFFADVAVGGVELVEAVAENGADNDFLRVLIRWSGHTVEAKVPGFLPPDFNASRLYRHEMIMMRRKGVKSSDKNILSSIHCPNCGAPETKNPLPVCAYCQTPLNDGSHDWILNDIRIFSGFPAVAENENTIYAGGIELPDADTLAIPDSDSLISGAVAMMLADGQIAPAEYELLSRFAEARKIPVGKLAGIIDSVAHGTLKPIVPEDPVQGEIYLRAMATMCLADGKISAMETRLFYDLGAKINFDKAAVRAILSRLRQDLLKKTRHIR